MLGECSGLLRDGLLTVIAGRIEKVYAQDG